MCRGRPGCSHFVLDRMKQQAPVWRESYRARVGAKRARWWVDGKPGNRPDYRSNRNRSSEHLVDESRINSGPLLLGGWEPTLVLDQATQIFDLTGVARVAVNNAGEPDA
jgi:hypothetical protein